jgi:signal transduction histidine kinase
MVHKLYTGAGPAGASHKDGGPARPPRADAQDVVSQLSHDLRTPLGSVLGFADLLLDGAGGSLSEEQRRHLRQIKDSGRRMLDILERCLRRVEADR